MNLVNQTPLVAKDRSIVDINGVQTLKKRDGSLVIPPIYVGKNNGNYGDMPYSSTSENRRDLIDRPLGKYQIYIPRIINPVDVPPSLYTDEAIRIIQQMVIKNIQDEHMVGDDIIPVPEPFLVRQIMATVIRTLYPLVDVNTVMWRTTKIITDDFREKIYNIKMFSTQDKGSVTEVNMDRIRRNLPRKTKIWVDIA